MRPRKQNGGRGADSLGTTGLGGGDDKLAFLLGRMLAGKQGYKDDGMTRGRIGRLLDSLVLFVLPQPFCHWHLGLRFVENRWICTYDLG